MEVQKGSGSSMNDSSKRRACQEQPVPESDSEDGQDWEQVPEVEAPQVISKEIWEKIYGKENVRITIPDNMSVEQRGNTRTRLGASYQ